MQYSHSFHLLSLFYLKRIQKQYLRSVLLHSFFWKKFSFDLDSASTAYSPDLTWSETGRFINELIILNTSDKPNVSGELWVDDIKLIY